MCWSLTPGRVPGADEQLPVRRLEPGLLGQLAPGRVLGCLAVPSRVPAGISSTMASTAARYWRTRVTVPSSCSGHHGHRTGVADDDAVERLAVGVDAGGSGPPGTARPGGAPPPRRGGSPAPARRLGDGVEVEQVRLAALGPLERRRHQLAEERVGPVGPALELGVGLGRHPERVVRAARRTRPGGRRARCPSRPGRPPRAGPCSGC